MIYLPFIYFSFLLIRHIRYKGFDVYAYIVLIYAVSAFLSICVDAMDLYRIFDIFKHPLGIVAPLAYCFLLTLCFQPFKRLDSNRIKDIVSINEKRYNIIIYSFFMLFLIILICSITRIQDILFNNAFAAIRNDFYNGEGDMLWSAYSGWFRYFVALCSMVSPCSKIMILFFFINISFFHKPFWFNVITLTGSFSQLLQSIFMADRSGFIHYIIIVGLCFVMFKNNIAKKTLKIISLCGCFIISLLLFYIISVTVSRFGGPNGNISDALGSIVYYAGSSYIHFCNFFNVLDNNAPFSMTEILPLSYWLTGSPGYFEQAQIVESYYHHGVSNFSTFLGMILSISGKIIMFIFAYLYYIIGSKITYRRNKNRISIRKLIYCFIIILVVSNGLFGYHYMSYSSTVSIILWILMAKYISHNNKKMIQHPILKSYHAEN